MRRPSDRLKQSLYFSSDMQEELEREAKRLDRSFSWVALNAMRAGLATLAEAERRALAFR